MDLVTQTSLEALLLKATNPQNQNVDTAAVEAFCTLINKEKDGAHIGVKVIASRLPSGSEKEMLQTLNILDTCMSKCGTAFQSEVGKFRFLNEMIKLVSPKYLGSQTPLIVKQKVLQLMYIWTLDYPRETKIKEAYDMLRKQGVIREIPNPNIVIQSSVAAKKKQINSVFHDEEKSKILQKLLQSKDPEDIQAANWLIKSMVKEDDKRAELKSRRISELESVQNNVRLLNEMLDSYKHGISSTDELDLIKELHQSCERLRPNLMKLATETPQSEEILSDVLQASDELTQVFSKFNNLIINGKMSSNGVHHNSSLLDIEHSTEEESQEGAKCNDIDVLCDIFNNTSDIPDSVDILKPVSILPCDKTECEKDNASNKFKALEELNVLSDRLLKENLPASKQIQKNQDKIPMNLMVKLSEIKSQESTKSEPLNFDYLLNNKSGVKSKAPTSDSSADDVLVDISDEKMLEANGDCKDDCCESQKSNTLTEPKLSDICIKLEEIKPCSKPPLTILNDRSGLTITLHFVRDKPRKDVQIFVVTTVSKNESSINNFLFQAVVPKGCKLKLQPPSATVLPAFNPFLPPSAITQIMLLSRPPDVKVFLKFIVSFAMDDETCTEMGEVEELPPV